jgi:hypothetical protein
MSVRDIAREFPVSESTLWRWCRRGVLCKPISVGRKKYWQREWVEEAFSGVIGEDEVRGSGWVKGNKFLDEGK